MEDASEATALAVVSIHTPARGVTAAGSGSNDIYKGFNPHSRTGSDASFEKGGDGNVWFQSTLPHGE